MTTMNRLKLFSIFAVTLLTAPRLCAQQKDIPEALKPWAQWATWDDPHLNCPTPYTGEGDHSCFWPSRMSLEAGAQSADWKFEVNVFAPTFVPLPGSNEQWPSNVKSDGDPIAVVERSGIPSVLLPPGLHQISGGFRWDEMPQRIAIPKQIGILSLTVNGSGVPIPNWDLEGNVWFQRLRTEEADKDLVAVQVYRAMDDGIPLWLQTEIEITVAGKSREEQLGWAIPQGWLVSTVDSPIPVAIDELGRLKAQVRAGKWIVKIAAFRSNDVNEFRFAPDAIPITPTELIGFKSNPDLRVAEIEGLQPVDVSQTTYPEKWRELPTFRWENKTSFRVVEKMRGMGLQRPEGLHLARHLWLDEDGRGFIYRDEFNGRMQQVWRLDVAQGQDLGAVRIDGEPQLITANPQSGEPGVEIRDRNLRMEGIGRVDPSLDLSAVGWQTDADSLRMTLSLPPGWRVLAVFGADRVVGDWLTAWTLLDLFVLLIFSLAVMRLWGPLAALIAIVALGLSYQELGAPRLAWLFLLIPLALLRVIPEGSGKRWIGLWKNGAVVLLFLLLIPFVARQVQAAIYPQLEVPGMSYGADGIFTRLIRGMEFGVTPTQRIAAATHAPPLAVNEIILIDQSGDGGAFVDEPKSSMDAASSRKGQESDVQTLTVNMANETSVVIQTGPAAPEWTWNQVICDWSGPVAAEQRIRPILISLSLNRILTVVRIAFLLLLAAIILGFRHTWTPFSKPRMAAIAVLFLCLLSPGFVAAQIPDQEMLNTLRQRLTEKSDAFPQAAEIAQVELKLENGKVAMRAEIHAATNVAVPLPGRLPDWSPVSVKIDDRLDAIVYRNDGYLWITVPQGVHHVVVEGMLPDVTEWEWGFLLKPRRVTVDAPGWAVTGVRPNGVPEQQIILTRVQKAAEGAAAYDQKIFNVIVAVERNLEVGLVWKVHNVVQRLSAPGKAISLKIPLLPRENVLSSNAVVDNGWIEIRLGAGQDIFQWESELPATTTIELKSDATELWVERWHLVTSPVWNVSMANLLPIYEAQDEKLIPTWHPWPGEGVSLALNKPEAVSGATLTVRHVQHETSVGARHRTSNLILDVESSLGGDFELGLNPDAEITSLKIDGRLTPVRRDQSKLIIPLQRAQQSVDVAWRTAQPISSVVSGEMVVLPVEAANIVSIMGVPENRWILWTAGPLRGPAVRFWVVLACALLAAWILGSLALSPLSRMEWLMLNIGLTQVHLFAALLVVAWLFILARRGTQDPSSRKVFWFNVSQIGIVLLTGISLVILVVVVAQGLLGNPDMFIVGNQSSRLYLQWFQPRVDQQLPAPYFVSVSVWYFRLLMLLWALWLASALLRWLRNGWVQFGRGGFWRRRVKNNLTPTTATATST